MTDNTKHVLPAPLRTAGEEMRKTYGEALIRLGEKDDRLIAIEADVMHSMGTTVFAARFPERSINCGIEEQNAIGVAAGLSLQGFHPVFHAFGPFATRRVFDQIFLSCGYQKSPILIVGGDAGITAAANGGTHMPLEDVALMRSVPGMEIVEPADNVAMEKLLPQFGTFRTNTYCRCTRKRPVSVYQPDADLRFGEASLLRDGSDAVILACGLTVSEALTAAEALAAEGISAAVADVFTVSPPDREAILALAEKTGAVVTAENHRVNGGLGSAAAELLIENYPVPLLRVGVPAESYGEVGDVPYLTQRFGIGSANIISAVREVLRKKR